MSDRPRKIVLPEDDAALLEECRVDTFRSSGPGGQHVNKVASAGPLRCDDKGSPSLPPAVRESLLRLAGSRVTLEGVLVIEARRFRSQHRNREDAVERLVELIRRAAETPKKRRKTRPSRGSWKTASSCPARKQYPSTTAGS